jgi:quinol monooxygenase YgiN
MADQEQFCMITRAVAAPERRDEVLALMLQILDLDRGRPGLESLVIHTEVEQPNVIWTYEIWSAKEALEAHRDHVRAHVDDLRPMMDEWFVGHDLTAHAATGCAEQTLFPSD